ncbi:DUF748 domain-containing protein [Hymenobacter tibetensis]|uniref:DUF748 domain-containing protein n=1 Tax=Hymenobacter tibetensis TaxID=497967 RepID=A0ABY4CX44_9BACT|nr:DUF748 domain-containing protein [Hymenobacter tibetensis]UOG73586.1 DUF748 domain-containing protein [Hymenobacter tibetensis]
MIDSSLPAVHDVSTTPRPKRWLRVGLWLLAGVLLVLCVALALLDPWLRYTLEKQMATASQGRYRLVIDELRTHLWSRTVVLRGVHVRSEKDAAATGAPAKLPDLTLDLAELRIAGIGLGAAVRRQVVPIQSIVLETPQLQLGILPNSPSDSASKPLHQQLPLGLPGVRVGYVAVRHMKARYGTVLQTQVQVQQVTLTASDLDLSAAGAADTTRLAYAASVKAEVRSLLARLPGHVGRLQHGTFSSMRQQLTLDSVRVVPLQSISNQRSRAARVDAVLPQLRLNGLRAAGLPRGRFQADELRLAGLRLLATAPSVAPPPLHELLAPYLPNFSLGKLHLTQAQVQIMGVEQAPAVRDINVTALHVQLRPDTQGQLYYASAWMLRTGPGRLRLDVPYYRVTFRALQADTRRRIFVLSHLALGPTMSVAALARSKGHQSVHARIRIPQVQASGFDWEALLDKGSLLAQHVEVRNARVLTESDGRFPINPNQSVATPDAIGRLPFPVDVRRLRIADLGLRMSYRSPRSAQPGVLAMQQLTGTLLNISNDPRRMHAAQPMTGQLTGRIQKVCKAQVTLRANLLDPQGKHTLTGTLGPTPLAVLNPMITPTRGLRLRSGQIEQIRFQMQLDRQQAQGTMWASYHDLKLELLNGKNRPGVLHRLETSVVNGVFLRDNNPRKPGEELKSGAMRSARELRFSAFTLWRQGIVSGMLNSAGVPAVLAKKISERE